jgi:DNA-binding transcriptional MerR regulator
MLRIGDFSQLGQVSVRTLRLYDELGLLKPAHIDQFTDYRYYSMEQLPRLNRILALKDLGFSLDQIARLVNEPLSAEQLQGMLLLKQSELEQEVEEAQNRLARVEARLRQIAREGQQPQYEIVVKKVTPFTIASLRQIVPTMDQMTTLRCAMYDSLYRRLSELRIKPLDAEFALYHATDYTEQDIDMEAAVQVEADTEVNGPFSIHTLPAVETMASVVHTGRFMDVVDAVVALYAWAGANGQTAAGPYREIHLFGRENDWHDYNNVVVEVQLPVTPA